jgi:hypothetical protein
MPRKRKVNVGNPAKKVARKKAAEAKAAKKVEGDIAAYTAGKVAGEVAKAIPPKPAAAAPAVSKQLGNFIPKPETTPSGSGTRSEGAPDNPEYRRAFAKREQDIALSQIGGGSTRAERGLLSGVSGVTETFGGQTEFIPDVEQTTNVGGPRASAWPNPVMTRLQERQNRITAARESEAGRVVNLGAKEGGLESAVGTAKPEPTEAQLRSQQMGRFQRTETGYANLGLLPTRKPRLTNVYGTEGPLSNVVKRISKGMGTSDDPVKAEAMAIAHRDYKNKLEAGEEAEAPSWTEGKNPVAGGHYPRLVRVMHHFGVTEDQLKPDHFDSGLRFEDRIKALHSYVQSDKDSKQKIYQTPEEGDYWQHPGTGELHKVSDNHPDMPTTFERNKGATYNYLRNQDGSIKELGGVYEGWNREKRRGGHVWTKRTADPGTGKMTDLIGSIIRNPVKENSGTKSKVASAINSIATGGRKVIGYTQAMVPNLASTVHYYKPIFGGPKPETDLTEGGEGSYDVSALPETKRGRKKIPVGGLVPGGRAAAARKEEGIVAGVTAGPQLPAEGQRPPKGSSGKVKITRPAVGPVTEHGEGAQWEEVVNMPKADIAKTTSPRR